MIECVRSFVRLLHKAAAAAAAVVGGGGGGGGGGGSDERRTTACNAAPSPSTGTLGPTPHPFRRSVGRSVVVFFRCG